MSDTPNAIDAITAAKPSPGEQHFPKFKVTPGLVKEAKALVAQYPEGKEQSAVLPIIHLVQEKFGFICADAKDHESEQKREYAQSKNKCFFHVFSPYLYF